MYAFQPLSPILAAVDFVDASRLAGVGVALKAHSRHPMRGAVFMIRPDQEESFGVSIGTFASRVGEG